MKYQTLAAVIAIALLSCACGDGSSTPAPDTESTYSGPILIWNLSQFELRKLYTHGDTEFELGRDCSCDSETETGTETETQTDSETPADNESYEVRECGNTNQLCEFLQPDTATVIYWSHDHNVSVIREKTQGGLLLGLTTQNPPMFVSKYSVLIVFDDGFRALVSADEAQATQGFPGFPPEITEYQAPYNPYDY